MTMQWLKGAGIALFGWLLVAGCAKKEAPKPKPPVPVTVALAAAKSVPVQVAAIGNVEAYNTVAIKAQVNGIIAKVHFKEGDDVREGQLLFTIDQRPFAAALRQAEATLKKDQAQAKYAADQAARYAGLVKEGIVTQDQYEQLRSNAEALDATVVADRAAVDNAKVNHSYCSIRSPIGGRTGNLQVREGNLVKANDVPVLVTINQVSPIYATFSVPERDLAEIRKHQGKGGLKVRATVTGQEATPEEGNLSFLDNAVDTTTGTIKVKGTFANRQRRLWPGQFVNVVVVLATREKAVVVPTQAVQTGQQGQFVFVVKGDGTVDQRPVTTGPVLAGEVVLEQGVQAGEKVVVDGQMRLVPGAKVDIKQPGAPGVQKQPTTARKG